MASTLEWFQKIAERLVRQEEKSTHREPNLFPRVYDSRLEDRRVLNAGAIVSAVDLLALRFDAGQSANDGRTDKFELVRLDSSNGANQIAVTINDQRVWQGSTTELQSVRFDGSNDADQFFIDPTIQFRDGMYVNGTGVATGPQSLGSSDLVVFATTSQLRFDEIMYQTTDQLTQVRFASPSQHLNSLVQVQNVETIMDLSLATDRTIAIGSQDNFYVLRNEQRMSEQPALQFSHQKNRLEFAVPSNRLTIDTLAVTATRNSILIDTVNLEGLDQLKIAGSDSDIVRQQGHLTIGRSLTIEAGTIDIDGSIATGPEGEVRLDAGPGILTVNGVIISRGDDLQRGGSVVLMGDSVRLQEWTRIDVSGGTGGGQIRVGGGYQGKDSTLRNSHHTYVAATASLNADARINGNGGTVIVWSDDTAIVEGSGNIFARGGSTAGDGGFIETSGKKFLKVDGAANAFAFQGKSGTWLLDPNNIEIVTTAGATPLTSYVLISTIVAGLATGNVSIITNTASAGDGDITIVDALTLAPLARTLTLNATRDIKFLSGLTGNSNLQVSLVAGRDVDTSAVSIGQLGALTVSAARNISLGSVNLSGGTFVAMVDSDNNDSNATFQSTGALSAGTISISGSTAVNDDVTFGSTVTSTTGAILFSKIDDLALQGDVTAATNVTFTNVTGPLVLGSNADVTANNGSLDFSSIASGVLLGGANGTTNSINANGSNSGLTLSKITATNSNVSLTLTSDYQLTADDIDIQSGTLDATFNDLNTKTDAVASFQVVTAGRFEVSGNSRVNDQVQLNGIATIGTGGVLIDQYNDLEVNAALTSTGNITTTGIVGSKTHLAANVISEGGNIAMNGGTLFIDGNAARSISSGGGAVATGGSITLGSVDGENGAADLTIDSRGTATAGSVSLGSVTATSDGLNRLNIRTDSPTAGQVTLGSIRLVAKSPGTAASLIVNSNGVTILASGTIDLSSNSNINGGSVDLGLSKIAPITSSSTLTIKTNNTKTSGGDGGVIKLGGVVNNGVNYFDSLLLDTSAANSSKTQGDLDFGGTANPTLAVDGTSGTGISLIGTILKAFSGALSFLTNPGGVTQSSSSIDVTKADFKTTQGLTFDTSGGNNSTTAGNVLIGDVGISAAERPTAINVDTRGTTTTGDLLLDDGAGTATELHVNGDLTLTTTKVKLTDNGVIRTYGTGNMTLGEVATSTATARNLTLDSQANIAVGSIALLGGSLTATIDSNNNDAGATFQSTGALSAGAISIAGSTTVNDHVTIGSTATSTTGAIQFSKIDDLALQGDVTAATNVTFTNVTGPLVLGSNADVTANNGSLDFSSIASGVLLGGVTGSTNLIEARGNTSLVSLAPVTTTNDGVRLNVRSDYSADLQRIEMQSGTLDVTIGRSTTRTDASVLLRHVTAGRMSVAGTSQLHDTAVLSDTLAIGANGVTIQNFSVLDVNANVQSVGDVVVNNIGDRIRIAGSIRVESNGGIDLQGNVRQIQLIGADGSGNTFQANGDASFLKLAELSSLQNVNLVISSANSVHLLGVDTKNGNLTINVDGNINTVGSRLDSNSLRAGQIAISGSAAKDDLAEINGSIEARTGNIVIDSFGSVSWNGDVTASSTVQVTNLSNRLNVGSGRVVRSLNGDIDLATNLNQVNFLGGGGTTTTIAAINGNLQIAAMTETISSSLIELRADRDVLLRSSMLTSNLLVVAGDHNGSTGSINTVFTLAASTIRLEAATGIGTTSALATSASSIVAVNRFSGAIDIANNLFGPVLVSNLESNLGGNIDFRQSGGGLVRFLRVTSNPDTSPAANEATIRLRNDGAGLVVGGTGVIAGGLGGVNLETFNAGDIQLDSNVQALNGGVSINSARRIVGNGPVQGLAINLNAGTGIGTVAPLQTQSAQLNAITGSGAVNVTNSSSMRANVSELRSNASGSIVFHQVGGGDVSFSSVSTGFAISNADSNIRLFNDNGSILVERASPITGGIVAGGGGSILFTAQNNLVLESGAIIQTQGAAATIRGNAGGMFQFINGATIRAGSSNPTTEAVLTRIPPLISVQPVVNSDGVNVDSEGVASILVQLGGPNPILVDRNFSVVIDWGDKQVDHLPNGLISSGTTNPQIARFDASGVNYQITHKYLGNPSPNDPVADIPILVKVGADSLNRIQFTDSQGAASTLFQVFNESLVVPAAGLFSLKIVLPQAPTSQNRFVFNSALPTDNSTTSSPAVKSAEIEVSSGNSSVEQKPSYVLRVITPTNEAGEVDSSDDILLTESDIDDLSGLFRRLGDDRYRIYLIRGDGSQMMLKDFYLRNHRPIEIDDALAPETLPAEERVLDESASVSTERSDTVMTGMNEDGNMQSNEEKTPVTNATAAIVASAPAMRSWRKAARRFRAS